MTRESSINGHVQESMTTNYSAMSISHINNLVTTLTKLTKEQLHHAIIS